MNIRTKLEECGKNVQNTSSQLDSTQNENKKLREDLKCQNDKFQKRFAVLEAENKNLNNDIMNQKVK